MPVTGFNKTNSSDDLITDSAAGATAFTIGKKTYNGAIGVDKKEVPKKTILEMAVEKGLGIIARMPLQFGLLAGKFNSSSMFPTIFLLVPLCFHCL